MKRIYYLTFIILILSFKVWAKGIGDGPNPKKDARIIKKQLKKNLKGGEANYVFDFRGDYYNTSFFAAENEELFNEVANNFLQETGYQVSFINVQDYLMNGTESKEDLERMRDEYIRGLEKNVPDDAVYFLLIPQTDVNLEGILETQFTFNVLIGAGVDMTILDNYMKNLGLGEEEYAELNFASLVQKILLSRKFNNANLAISATIIFLEGPKYYGTNLYIFADNAHITTTKERLENNAVGTSLKSAQFNNFFDPLDEHEILQLPSSNGINDITDLYNMVNDLISEGYVFRNIYIVSHGMRSESGGSYIFKIGDAKITGSDYDVTMLEQFSDAFYGTNVCIIACHAGYTERRQLFLSKLAEDWNATIFANKYRTSNSYNGIFGGTFQGNSLLYDKDDESEHEDYDSWVMILPDNTIINIHAPTLYGDRISYFPKR